MSEIVVALISLVGTLLGSMFGVLTSQKLTSYRISKLEEQVSKHNNLIDRMYKIESRVTVLEDIHKK